MSSLDDPADAALEAALRAAIRAGELEVHYQPTVDARENRVVGFEALVRWQHPELGSLSPARFLPVAERSGLIVALGLLVLRRACDEGVRLLRQMPDRRLPISVNISARQLVNDGVTAAMREVIAESGLDPALLCVELTESGPIEDLDRISARLAELRALGVGITIDDFGTGHSSLTHLKRFRADALKIDRGFVAGLGRDDRDTEIVKAIVSIAQSLDMEVIAEGVEHADQLEMLLELGCSNMQGYFWSAPVRSGRLLDTIDRISRLADRRGGALGAAGGGAGAAEQALMLLDHELRNPLTVIAGHLDIFEDTQQGAVAAAAVRAMRRALATMTRTLESFASVHTLEGGGRPLVTGPLDVTDLVYSIVEELTPVMHGKRLVVDPPEPRVHPAEADEHATRLILVNLLTNADKYAPVGSDVCVSVDSNRNCVSVVVTDGGEGISAADAERVFEKFERASTATKGYGLGLYLSRQLARSQRGDLTYACEPGGGAAFRLDLPRA